MLDRRSAGNGSRKLGEQERLFHYLHAFGALIAVQVLHVRGTVDPKRLEEALGWLQRQHPVLQAHIEYGGPVFRKYPPFVYRQPYFVTEGTTPIPLRIVTDPAPDAWKRVFEYELRKPLRRGRNPRLRAVLVRASETAAECQVFLTADHAIADAQATNMASRDLMAYLSDPQSVRDRKPVHDVLPAPLEAGLPKQAASANTYTPVKRIPTRRGLVWPVMALASRSFDLATTERLKAAARTERTTLHGAICAAFLTAFRDKYGLHQMTTLSTVDLRRMCKPAFPAETFGCYIDLMRTAHPIRISFWDTARDVSFKLVTSLAKDRESASLMKLPNWDVYREDLVPTLLNRRRLDGLAVTTAGESGLKQDYGALHLEGVTMAVSTLFLGTALFVISSERSGALDLFVGYATDALAPADAEDLTTRAAQLLTEAAAVPATVS